jgi:hypothetical protein
LQNLSGHGAFKQADQVSTPTLQAGAQVYKTVFPNDAKGGFAVESNTGQFHGDSCDFRNKFAT